MKDLQMFEEEAMFEIAIRLEVECVSSKVNLTRDLVLALIQIRTCPPHGRFLPYYSSWRHTSHDYPSVASFSKNCLGIRAGFSTTFYDLFQLYTNH